MKPICPECKIKMHKAGFQFSGRHKVQRYKCNKCGYAATETNKNIWPEGKPQEVQKQNAKEDAMYRLVIGEQGNEQGHIKYTNAKTLRGAKTVLSKELEVYGGDGWGRIEYQHKNGEWERL